MVFGNKKKSNTELMQEKYKEERLEKDKERLEEILSKVIIFPGNKQEFEELMGYECSIIDVEYQDKGIYCRERDEEDKEFEEDEKFSFDHYNPSFKKMLVDKGIVGIIHSINFGDYYEFYQGLPVRRK